MKWIKSFLTGRKQRVRVGHVYSRKTEVLSGIPQGSILGPVLFTIFINDLPSYVQSTCKVFADDTKIYNTTSEHNIIQNDLNNLQKWSDDWNLYFNVSKCKVMHIGRNNPKSDYTMKLEKDVQKITSCNEEKDLGVVFDNLLNFDLHIQKAVNKANQMLGVIKRTFNYLNKETFLLLYKSMVRPHLEYGNIIWYPCLKRQSTSIERVQRRATRMIKECRNMNYEDRLKLLNLHSLKGRRIRGDLIETYKLYNNLVDICFDSFFSLTVYDKTRNQEGKLHIQRYNTNKRKHCFGNRVANIWNSLPHDYKTAPSTNIFKNLLDADANFSKIFFDYDD